MVKNRRSLTDEEAALWESVARTAKPLRSGRPLRATPPRETGPPPMSERQASSVAATAKSQVHHAPRGLGHIDRRVARRIARGAIALDARLDLHGLTQAEAHRRLIKFLDVAYEEGSRIVLIITGKGAYDDGNRGVLRRALPQWLELPPLRGLVSSYDQAHRSHGGAGAFYVRLKRSRPDL